MMPGYILYEGRVAAVGLERVDGAFPLLVRVDVPVADGRVLGGGEDVTLFEGVPGETVAVRDDERDEMSVSRSMEGRRSLAGSLALTPPWTAPSKSYPAYTFHPY